ncbi:MAG TPA: YceI family protein [Ktedonobacterales bacterium]|nr:YceI family protein [Ktedonobacterales bacterium]
MAWEIDQAHSLIEFSAKHMMVTTVKGRFTKFSGTIDIDEADPTASVVDVTIDANSVATGDEKRDGHLRSPDFFDAAQYPTLTYKSTRVERTGEDSARAYGDLTIKGVTRPVTLEVTREGETKNMRGERLMGFSVRTAINRKEWGLNWNVALEAGGVLVSDKINIAIDAEVFEPAPAQPELASA